MFYVLLVAIALVHLEFEYRVWVRREEDVFQKYRDDSISSLSAAKWAYYCKAFWLVLVVFLQVGGIDFKPALIISFSVYAGLIQILLPFRIYNILNLALALGCLAELAWQTWG